MIILKLHCSFSLIKSIFNFLIPKSFGNSFSPSPTTTSTYPYGGDCLSTPTRHKYVSHCASSSLKVFHSLRLNSSIQPSNAHSICTSTSLVPEPTATDRWCHRTTCLIWPWRSLSVRFWTSGFHRNSSCPTGWARTRTGADFACRSTWGRASIGLGRRVVF